MRRLGILGGLVVALAAVSLAADRPPILPNSFAGWQMDKPAQTSSDPSIADPVNAALLKEYGFTDFASATYLREGRKLTIKAARFNDVSGAFGAYTFYYQPEMRREAISDQGASFNQKVLFYRGNVLIDAVFEQVTAMSTAELRTLSSVLPMPSGSAGNAPPVLGYMPRQGYIKNTEKYVVGPLGYAQISAALPVNLIDFPQGAEVVLGRYKVGAGEATLMVISYPTPQIAAEQMRKIDEAHTAAQQHPGDPSILQIGPFYDKRSGPLLAVASGPISQSDARDLLGAVNYDADVTWSQNTFFDKKNNLANLLVNIILLCGILIGLALVAGLAFGGLRVAIGRLLPGRIFDRAESVEFISLHLAEEGQRVPDSKLSSSIKAS